MTFRSIDRQRFSYLLGFGTQPAELKRFFDDNLKALLNKGARIRNAPHGSNARIKLIVERLPAASDEILRHWFSKHITMVDPVPADKLVELFKAHEIDNSSPSKEDAPHLARSCLVHLFSESPPEGFVAFLQSPLPGSSRSEASGTAISVDERDGPIRDGHPNQSLLALLVSAYEGAEPEDLLDELPANIANFVEGLLQIREGDERAAGDALLELSPDSEEAKLLSKAIRRLRSAGRRAGPKFGLNVHPTSVFEGDLDSARVRVFAYCTNDRSTATFLKPIGVINEQTLALFSDDQRVQYFPESGDIISFQGQGRMRQPVRGEVGIWDVGEHETDKRTRCHIQAESGDLFRVIRVPIHSSDADSVRAYIKQFSEERSVGRRPVLFELLDGPVIGPKSPRADLSRDDTYEEPFRRWDRLNGFSFESDRFVAGPLPEAKSQYDCAPLSVSVRFCLRSLRERMQIQLTRAQVREIVALFEVTDDAISRQRMARIIERIESAQVEEAVLNDMVEFALEMPEVKRRVQEGVELRVEEMVRERQDLKAEISRLHTELESASTRLRSAEQATKRQVDETSATVKNAFDRALSNGVDALASAKIFDVLAARFRPRVEGHNAEPSGQAIGTSRTLPDVSTEDTLGILKTCGLSRRFAVVLLAAVLCAWRSGIAVLLRGGFARQVALAIARQHENASIIDVPIGLTAALSQISVVINDPKTSTLIILNANVSDFGIYGAALLDFMVESSAGYSNRPALNLVGSLTDSQFALELPAEVSRFGMTIDLDWSSSFELNSGSRDPEWFSDVIKTSKLDDKIGKRLLDEVGKLSELEENGVTMMIARAISRNCADGDPGCQGSSKGYSSA